jgi:hypothetical protein
MARKKQLPTEQAPAELLIDTTVNSIDELKDLLTQTINKCDEIMNKDRSKVLRLKMLKNTLVDVQRRLG